MNLIIDSKKSIEKGAKIIQTVHISKEKAEKGLNKLQESCMEECCNADDCDSALLSMRLGEVKYFCFYLLLADHLHLFLNIHLFQIEIRKN